MAKDTKGHGSDKRGLNSQRGLDAARKHLASQVASGMMHPAISDGQARAKLQTTQGGAAPPHSATPGAERKIVYIDKHPDLGGEMKVVAKGAPKSHGYYTDDKADAIGTAYAMHGKDIEIKHRRKRYD